MKARNLIILDFLIVTYSDIGGGYAEGDLSDVALMWVINEARKAGINFQVPTKYTKVTNPVVHDSVKDSLGFTPSREFLWAEQSSHSPKQFEPKSHSVLTWADTLDFEPDSQSCKLSKFQQVKVISEAFLNAPSCNSSKIVCLKKSKQQYLKDYQKLKSSGGKDSGNTIIYNNKTPAESIEIKEYID